MYTIDYWYRDPVYNKECTGTYYTTSLIDVGAFFAMIKRYGGTCHCSLDIE